MANVAGRLMLDLTHHGDVRIAFLPNDQAGEVNPLLSKSIAHAEKDVESLFGVEPQRAKELIDELKIHGHAARTISIDEDMSKKFFWSR